MTTFVVVDVETTSTSPWNGQLLTIGAVAVIDGLIGDTFYKRLSYVPIIEGGDFDEATLEWWDQQNPEAYTEAYSWEVDRISPYSVAHQLQNWVRDLPGEQKYFAANPASFDWNWIDKLFVQSQLITPFHYRTLCLRSAWYGKAMGTCRTMKTAYPSSDVEYPTWGDKRDGHESERPHHALYDAMAEAYDLIELL